MRAPDDIAVITASADLATAVERFRAAEFVTVDTEFMRESTFWPKLCVVQIADETGPVVIDALAPGLDLSPFFALMADEHVLKVFHSGRQDIEIVWHLAGLVPHPVFDTQIAAMVLGHGESASYEQLVQRLTGAAIDKSSRFTDWSRRPLSAAQLAYAAADVTHLRGVYRKLASQLQKRGRAEWVAEEMAVLTSPDTYRQEPEQAWRRVKARIRKPKELAVLMEVAAWREREAQRRDVPRSRVLKDEALAEVAQRAPVDVEALGRLRALPGGFERSRMGADILAAVERGLARDPATVPMVEHARPASNGGATVELLKVLLKMVAEREGVAGKVLATTDDLERIATDDADVPALHGWRRELFGEKALELRRGELALALDRKGRVVTVATGASD
jgi:ribonuclease D